VLTDCGGRCNLLSQREFESTSKQYEERRESNITSILSQRVKQEDSELSREDSEVSRETTELQE
jgi:hypothetical protein